jgi:CRISPR-associated protein Cas5h
MENLTSTLSKKVLIFDIGSEYGHFRKFNTTTSPLTYSIPPRPAIVGLLGAILGIEREIGVDKFNDNVIPLAKLFSKDSADIAVQILNPIKKTNIAFNLLDTEKTASSFFNIKQRTQIEFELLKNPTFRIFVSLYDDKIFEELKSRVQSNKSFFTPYLGLSQFTATIQFKDIVQAFKLNSNDFIEILTAINLNNTERQFEFQRNAEFKYNSDTMPIELATNRVVTEYAEIIIETNGKVVKTKTKEAFQVEKYGNILFL